MLKYNIKPSGYLYLKALIMNYQGGHMPLLSRGVYSKSEDYSYELETTYQLKYYISSALISIDCILELEDAMVNRFENKIRYYRYYVDNLFYFLGLINDRFVYKRNRNEDELNHEKENRVSLNKSNYQFEESKFVILSNKIPRNIIEHLDERNVKMIMDRNGVGGFNVLFKDSNNKMNESIRTNRMMYPYTLDLVNNKVLFYDAQAKCDDMKKFEIDVLEIQDELKRLEKNVDDFDRFL